MESRNKFSQNLETIKTSSDFIPFTCMQWHIILDLSYVSTKTDIPIKMYTDRVRMTSLVDLTISLCLSLTNHSGFEIFQPILVHRCSGTIN